MPPHIGLIGGTDSSGGAGLQADLETCNDLACNSYPVISAITLQNTLSSIRSYPTPRLGIQSQLSSLGEVIMDAVKIGMIPDETVVHEVKLFLQRKKCKKIILDPVKKTSMGHSLISENGWHKLIHELLPEVDLVTPNVDEAYFLLGLNPLEKMTPENLACLCLELGPKAVLLKGGHSVDSFHCTDILCRKDKPTVYFKNKRIVGGSEVRGTGCRLASAIACKWAQGNQLNQAVSEAQSFLQNYIKKNRP